MPKESPRRRAAREKREKERETAKGKGKAKAAPKAKGSAKPRAAKNSPRPADPEPKTKEMPSDGVDSLRQRITTGLAGVAAVCALVALIVGIVALTDSDNAPEATPATANTSQVQDKDVLDPDSPALKSSLADRANIPANKEAANDYLRQKGFDRGDYCFRICVDHTVDRQSGAVSEESLLTNEALAQWLNSDNQRAQATRERAKSLLSPGSYQRFLSGAYHVRVQFKRPIIYTQNSAYADGQVVLYSGARDVGSGDILFLFVEEKKNGNRKVNDDGNVRGDCGNPHAVPGVPGGKPVPDVKPPSGGGEQPGPSSEPVETPSGGGETPGTETTPTPTPPTPTSEKPKRDTPTNTPGPTGNGKPQPVSETEPPAGPSPSSNHPPAPGTTSPHPTPPVPPPPSPTVPPAEDGGSTPKPTDNW